MNRRLILITLLACFLLPACRGRIKADDAIDATMRREVDSLNTVVLRALFEGRTEAILKLSTDEIRQSNSDRVQLRRLAKSLRGVPFTKIEVEHQLFSNKLRPDTSSKMVFREGTEQEYTFSFYQPGRATLATFGRIPVNGRELAFTTSFSRRSGKWELVGLELGVLRVENRNAVDWFYRAEQQLDAHDLVDALVQNAIARSTVRPAGWTIRYKMEPRILAQEQELNRTTSVNLNFPINTNPEALDAPQILGLSVNCDSTCLPMFTVFTQTPIADTGMLRIECDTICRNLDRWFPGVSNRNKTIAFRLINKPPQAIRTDQEYITLFRPTVADWRY